MAGVEGRCQIYPVIDLDIPIRTTRSEPGTRGASTPAQTTGIGGPVQTSGEITQCTREGVKAAVLAAFAGGAQGVVLSRKYSEMRLDILAGAGDAMNELGR